MKLYTLEQIKEAYKIGVGKGFANITIEDLKPIELPTRDMVDEAALTNSVESKIDFINGFIWTCSSIREQIN